MPAERLTQDELNMFTAEARRLGVPVIASMLEVEGVQRFSHLPKVRRVEFLNKLRAVRK